MPEDTKDNWWETRDSKKLEDVVVLLHKKIQLLAVLTALNERLIQNEAEGD